MSKNSLVLYKNEISFYSSALNGILEQIRQLGTIHKEILSGIWKNNIKYRSSSYRNFNNLQPQYYQERGKWVDFIYLVENNNYSSVEDLLKENLNFILLLFWKDIPNNLNSETVFKLQLKLFFIGSKEPFDKDLIYYDYVNIGQVCSVGSINIYSKNNFNFLFIRLF